MKRRAVVAAAQPGKYLPGLRVAQLLEDGQGTVPLLIGDGVLIGDAVLRAFNALTTGDATTTMKIVLDDSTDYLGY